MSGQLLPEDLVSKNDPHPNLLRALTEASQPVFGTNTLDIFDARDLFLKKAEARRRERGS